MKFNKFTLPLVSLMLFTTTCWAAECPVEVKINPRNIAGYPEIIIISTENSVTVKDVILNRGNVKVTPVRSSKVVNGRWEERPRFPLTLKFGEDDRFPIERVIIREIEVQTDKGACTFTFK